MPLTEIQTRQELIDGQLTMAGWGFSSRSLVEEFYIKSDSQVFEKLGHYASKGEFVDYVLLDKDNKPLAIVEAKRTNRDELAGKRQAADYADHLKKQFGFDPFIFLTNGNEIQFWDRQNYPPRKVSGFYTREDLERLAHQRKYSQPLSQIEQNASIAGRDYQAEAIRRVTETIEQKHRKLLLVMATGTGKTRTAISIIDILLRAKRIQRVLFLADRRELVRQAIGSFKEHLPNESIGRIEGGKTPSAARVQVATYPSMTQVYERLSVGHYDLIIADESHRSIYNRYKLMFDWFDAIQIGLTATPTDFIDHNTFELFGCDDGVPTFIFAISHAHAKRLYESFSSLYPEYQRKGL
jgi:type I restriction enzyme, R subunit